jgi:hypothetical protein
LNQQPGFNVPQQQALQDIIEETYTQEITKQEIKENHYLYIETWSNIGFFKLRFRKCFYVRNGVFSYPKKVTVMYDTMERYEINKQYAGYYEMNKEEIHQELITFAKQELLSMGVRLLKFKKRKVK